MNRTVAQEHLIGVGCILRLPNKGYETLCEAPQCQSSHRNKFGAELKDDYCLLSSKGYGHPVIVLRTAQTELGRGINGLEVTFANVGPPPSRICAF